MAGISNTRCKVLDQKFTQEEFENLSPEELDIVLKKIEEISKMVDALIEQKKKEED